MHDNNESLVSMPTLCYSLTLAQLPAFPSSRSRLDLVLILAFHSYHPTLVNLSSDSFTSKYHSSTLHCIAYRIASSAKIDSIGISQPSSTRTTPPHIL